MLSISKARISSSFYGRARGPSGGEPLVFKTKLIADGRSTTTGCAYDETRGTRKVTSRRVVLKRAYHLPVFGAVPLAVPTPLFFFFYSSLPSCPVPLRSALKTHATTRSISPLTSPMLINARLYGELFICQQHNNAVLAWPTPKVLFVDDYEIVTCPRHVCFISLLSQSYGRFFIFFLFFFLLFFIRSFV